MRPKSFKLFSRAALVLLMMMLTTTKSWAWTGEGFENDPILIANASDLIQLATNVNSGTDYSGKYFKQTNPITLTSAWMPIGTSAHPFKGHYDGGNNAISGLTVTGNYQYAGLFGYISAVEDHPGSLISTELKNINIVDCNINVGSVSGSEAGAIAGHTGPVHLTNCRVSGSITAYRYACGLVGLADVTYGNAVNNCFVDVTLSGTGNQYNQYVHPTVRLMLSVQGNTPSASGNYYHNRGGDVAVGCSATPLYTISAPSGLAVATTNATLTYNATPYFDGGATASLTVDDANKAIKTFSATGAANSYVAANKKRADVALASSNVTVSATLMDLTGTVNGVTWSMSDTDSNGTYDRLTLSGSGTLSTSPWATDFASSITRVNVNSADIIISGNLFSSLGNGAVIVVPTPAYAVSYASAAFASKLRVAFGSYLFLATNEGGTAAYKIASEQDLRNLASVINADNNEFGTGKTFRQTQDITMSATAFTPIGNNLFFEGTYDGGNHTITSLNATNTNAWAGLIARLNGTAKNIILVSPTVSSTCGSQAVVGAVAGTASNNATITNCRVINPTVTATANSNVHIGAIIGKTHSISSMSDCYFYDSDAASHNYTAVGDKTDQGSKITRVYTAHLVTPADASVTIQTAMAADLGFTYNANNYWREGAELTLGYSGDVPTGYAPVYSAKGNTLSGDTYTVNSTDGDVTIAFVNNAPITYTITYNLNGGALSTDKNSYTIESADITLDTPTRDNYTFLGWYANEGLTGPEVKTIGIGSTGDKQLWAKWAIAYIDADGTTQYCTNATVLTNSIDVSDLSAGWYVVTEDVDYNSEFNCYSGDIHLILCDDATMTVESNVAIQMSHGSLTIYAQSTGSGMGKLEATASDGDGIYANGNITICGGNITATGNSSMNGIYADHGSITIHSGQVSASGYLGFFVNHGTITLGLRNATDYITANSFYTSHGSVNIANGQTLIDGTAAYTGNNVSIPDGNRTLTLPVAVTLADGITATTGIITSGDNKYAKAGATVTVSTRGVTAPVGYTCSGITVSPTADVTDNGNGSYSFTMPAADATISATFLSDGQSHSISYMRANGTTGTHNAVALDETMTNLDDGWYFVGKNINYTQTVTFSGDAIIILCNGKTMSVGEDEDGKRIDGMGIYPTGSNIYQKSLGIYGQSLDAATAGYLKVYTDKDNCDGINCREYFQYSGNVIVKSLKSHGISADYGSITIYGGRVVASAGSDRNGLTCSNSNIYIYGGHVEATGGYGIGSDNGDITIYGGQVEANGSSGGIYTSFGDITLGWSRPTDYIKASPDYVLNNSKAVKIADGQTFWNGTEKVSGTIYNWNNDIDYLDKVNGKTLRPFKTITLADNADNNSTISGWNGGVADVTLSGRTLYKDGYWNTLCLPFAISDFAGTPLEDATVKELLTTSNLDNNGTLTLNFTTVSSIEAGKPYIVKWSKSDDLVDPVFEGVTIDKTTHDVAFTGGSFKGNYSPLEITDANRNDILLLAGGNKLGYAKTDRTIANGKALGACRAYFYIPSNGGGQGARAFELNFGEEETTGIVSTTDGTDITDKAGAIFDLQGRKVENPKKGMYIVNGKVVVIK